MFKLKKNTHGGAESRRADQGRTRPGDRFGELDVFNGGCCFGFSNPAEGKREYRGGVFS